MLYEDIINAFLTEALDRFQDMADYHASNKAHSFIAFPKTKSDAELEAEEIEKEKSKKENNPLVNWSSEPEGTHPASYKILQDMFTKNKGKP